MIERSNMGVYRLLSSSISSRQLFTSGVFRSFLEDTTNNILKRYKRNKIAIRIVESSPDETACTDGKVTRINYNYYQIQALNGKLLQFKYMRGFNGHELGHVLFDDFTMLRKIQGMWKIGNIYPLSNYVNQISEEQKKNYDELKSTIEDDVIARMVLLELFLEVDNILSDSYVNVQVIKRLPTYKDDLQFVLRHMRKNLNTYDEIKEKGISKLERILMYIHYYSVYNLLFDVDDELVNEVIRLIPILDKIKTETHSELRTVYDQIIFCELWKYFREYIQQNQSEQNEDSESGDGEGSESGKSQGSRFGSKDDSDSFGENHKLNDLKVLAENLANNAMSKRPTNVNSSSVFESKGDGIFENISLNDVTNEVREKVVNEIKEEKDEETQSEKDKNFEKLLDDFKKKEEYKEKEQKHNEELNAFKERVDSQSHKNLTTALVRQINVTETEIETYENVFQKEVMLTARKIAEGIKDSLIKRDTNEALSGYYFGKRINFPAVVRQEMKLFERNNNLGKKSESAFMLICDESGSTVGERNYYLRMACMIFLQVAEILKFPVGIIGHKAETVYFNDSTSRKEYADVILNVYADFSEDNKDKYRLTSMTPYGCNRDGYAIKFACERLLKRNEENKVCIILTDGKPNAKGYSGIQAKEDCQMLYQKYKAKGIMVVVAAIGNDKQEIKEIYGDSFLDVKSVKEIPKVFNKILKELYKV